MKLLIFFFCILYSTLSFAGQCTISLDFSSSKKQEKKEVFGPFTTKTEDECKAKISKYLTEFGASAQVDWNFVADKNDASTFELVISLKQYRKLIIDSMNKYKKEHGKFTYNLADVMDSNRPGYVPVLFLAQWPTDCLKKFPSSAHSNLNNFKQQIEFDMKGLIKSSASEAKEKAAFLTYLKNKPDEPGLCSNNEEDFWIVMYALENHKVNKYILVKMGSSLNSSKPISEVIRELDLAENKIPSTNQ